MKKHRLPAQPKRRTRHGRPAPRTMQARPWRGSAGSPPDWTTTGIEIATWVLVADRRPGGRWVCCSAGRHLPPGVPGQQPAPGTLGALPPACNRIQCPATCSAGTLVLLRRLLAFRRFADELHHVPRFLRALALLLGVVFVENFATWAVAASDQRKYQYQPLQARELGGARRGGRRAAAPCVRSGRATAACVQSGRANSWCPPAAHCSSLGGFHRQALCMAASCLKIPLLSVL